MENPTDAPASILEAIPQERTLQAVIHTQASTADADALAEPPAEMARNAS